MTKRPQSADIEKLLKDELEGLRTAHAALIHADREKTAALDAYHAAYSAAVQRAELAETQSDRRETTVARLERELRESREQLESTRRALQPAPERPVPF